MKNDNKFEVIDFQMEGNFSLQKKEVYNRVEVPLKANAPVWASFIKFSFNYLILLILFDLYSHQN